MIYTIFISSLLLSLIKESILLPLEVIERADISPIDYGGNQYIVPIPSAKKDDDFELFLSSLNNPDPEEFHFDNNNFDFNLHKGNTKLNSRNNMDNNKDNTDLKKTSYLNINKEFQSNLEIDSYGNIHDNKKDFNDNMGIFKSPDINNNGVRKTGDIMGTSDLHHNFDFNNNMDNLKSSKINPIISIDDNKNLRKTGDINDNMGIFKAPENNPNSQNNNGDINSNKDIHDNMGNLKTFEMNPYPNIHDTKGADKDFSGNMDTLKTPDMHLNKDFNDDIMGIFKTSNSQDNNGVRKTGDNNFNKDVYDNMGNLKTSEMNPYPNIYDTKGADKNFSGNMGTLKTSDTHSNFNDDVMGIFKTSNSQDNNGVRKTGDNNFNKDIYDNMGNLKTFETNPYPNIHDTKGVDKDFSGNMGTLKTSDTHLNKDFNDDIMGIFKTPEKTHNSQDNNGVKKTGDNNFNKDVYDNMGNLKTFQMNPYSNIHDTKGADKDFSDNLKTSDTHSNFNDDVMGIFKTPDNQNNNGLRKTGDINLNKDFRDNMGYLKTSQMNPYANINDNKDLKTSDTNFSGNMGTLKTSDTHLNKDFNDDIMGIFKTPEKTHNSQDNNGVKKTGDNNFNKDVYDNMGNLKTSKINPYSNNHDTKSANKDLSGNMGTLKTSDDDDVMGIFKNNPNMDNLKTSKINPIINIEDNKNLKTGDINFDKDFHNNMDTKTNGNMGIFKTSDTDLNKNNQDDKHLRKTNSQNNNDKIKAGNMASSLNPSLYKHVPISSDPIRKIDNTAKKNTSLNINKSNKDSSPFVDDIERVFGSDQNNKYPSNIDDESEVSSGEDNEKIGLLGLVQKSVSTAIETFLDGVQHFSLTGSKKKGLGRILGGSIFKLGNGLENRANNLGISFRNDE